MAAKDIQSAALSKVNTSVVHAIGGTKVKETKKLFKWTIKNYSAWQDRGLEKDYMTSPTFSTGANDESKWFAKLCKGSYIKQYIGPLGLKDAETTILCEITEMEIVNISEQAQIMHRNAIRGKLSENLGTLLNNEKFSDVTLVASGLEVRAHKSILAARSDVFAAMFEHEMEENKLNRVVIKDIDHNVLKDMLKFVYTGTAPNLDTMSSDLLAAANKYGLEDLKALCADAISTKVSVNNSAKTLVLADIYDAGQLKADTIAYIKNHIADVMETQDWQDMTKTHSYLVGDVLRAFAKQ
uniref:BTB domain-containing protein n=1 Tax=Glossina palpalis gambiensis TaxID=67801 RepID=A0A1B0C1Z3_9MUSC